MNVDRPIYLPELRSEDEKGSLHQPPPPLRQTILYKKKGKFMGFHVLGPITDKIKIGGGYFTGLLIYVPLG